MRSIQAGSNKTRRKTMAAEGNFSIGLVLANPNANEELVHQVPQGGIVDLGDILENVISLNRDGDNFILTFEDGGTLTLQGFFPGEKESSTEPILVIDGHEVPYDLFMANYGDNIKAAAGTDSDKMIGGAGDDTFRWTEDGLGGTDNILDFDLGQKNVNNELEGGDRIDLRDLFSLGEKDILEQFLQVTKVDGEDEVTIKIDKDGQGQFDDSGASKADQIINVTVSGGNELSEQVLIDAVKSQILLDTGN